jgi:hypothetical protein
METISRQEYLKRWYQNLTEDQRVERSRKSLERYHKLPIKQKVEIGNKQKQYYQENKEKLKEYSRNYYHNKKKLDIFAEQ